VAPVRLQAMLGPMPSGRAPRGEIPRPSAAWTPPPPAADRDYMKMYVDHVLQANEGVDLDFLVGRSGSPVPRDNH
jgi:L-arabonate dehydrase